jgi:hypothetical protein
MGTESLSQLGKVIQKYNVIRRQVGERCPIRQVKVRRDLVTMIGLLSCSRSSPGPRRIGFSFIALLCHDDEYPSYWRLYVALKRPRMLTRPSADGASPATFGAGNTFGSLPAVNMFRDPPQKPEG